nr:hypothetical protein 35 [bacterium]
MAIWLDILNAEIEKDKPLKSTTLQKYRGNMEAMAEGHPNAPRLTGTYYKTFNYAGMLGTHPLDLSSYDELLFVRFKICLLYTSPSPRDRSVSRMPSSA